MDISVAIGRSFHYIIGLTGYSARGQYYYDMLKIIISGSEANVFLPGLGVSFGYFFWYGELSMPLKRLHQ